MRRCAVFGSWPPRSQFSPKTKWTLSRSVEPTSTASSAFVGDEPAVGLSKKPPARGKAPQTIAGDSSRTSSWSDGRLGGGALRVVTGM